MSTASDAGPPRGRRFWAMIAFAGLAFAAIGWTIAWILLALHLRTGIDNWMDARRAQGEMLVHGDQTLGGFPFAIRFAFENVEWRRVDGSRTLSAGADRLRVAADALSPTRLDLHAAGAVSVRWESPFLEGRMTTTEAGGWVDLAAAPVDRVAVDLTGVTGFDRAGAVIARADRLSVVVDPTPPPRPASPGSVPESLILLLTVDALEHAETAALRLPFEGPADASLSATVRGPLPLDIDPVELALWRDAGGVVDIDRLRIGWKPLDLTADGTLTLDGLMRPEGAATAEIRGLPATIDRSVDMGLLAPGLASLLKLATVAFSGNSRNGGGRAVRAPLTLQDGRFSIGPVAVARVAPLVR